ncbi:MAG: aminotransferase class V-fold PLP-dependent enzyme [Candidatus Heimdallarchaeota archaeon]|nr:aminotransferase class V-fold PLP-dependent enzyme [Candidatus Heimdallarchaeota archaeon]
MSHDPDFLKIRNILEKHHKYWNNAIPLIASENLTSPAVRELAISDLAHRYAEGWIGERVYPGNEYFDDVEELCLKLLRELYNSPFIDARPISGVVANLTVYTAFTQANDVMMAISIPVGGHISSGPLKASTGSFIGGTAGAVARLNVQYLPFDRYGLNIDIDKAKLAIQEKKPKLVQFGASVFLFPHPVKELAEIAHEVGAHINYDAAHVAGLIAGKQFQDPLREGTDTMTMSTHKTFPGPQKGIVIASREELAEKIKSAAFPGMTSNHHLMHVAGLAVAAAEFKKFGEAYSKQIITNAKALGQYLYERGFQVVCPDKGFTESHTLLVDISNFQDSIGLGADVEQLLEKASIIANRNLLPWDVIEKRNYLNPGGIRIGTQEITRLGMKQKEMETIAEFFKQVLIDHIDPKKIAQDIADFRQDFQTIHYGFESQRRAYEYIKIV